MLSHAAVLSPLLLAAGVFSHPDSSLALPEVDCSSFPPIMSYHVHVTYMLTNSDQIKAAEELRSVAENEFATLMGPDYKCHGTESDPSGRYDNGKLCMIYDHDMTEETLGPFPVGEWSMFVPVHYYNRVVPCVWMADHGDWAQWTGDKWNLDFSIFTKGKQTESFNQTLGTPENPSCLSQEGAVCAAPSSEYGSDSLGYAPQIVCCSGLTCSCEDDKSGVCHCVK